MEKLKEAVGWMVWQAAKRSQAARRLCAPLGLRTRQSWYKERVGEVELCGGGRAVLGSFDRNYLSFELFWKGWRYYEPYTALVLRELLSGARTFVDVGANAGYFALTAASSSPGVRVLAFEPNPKMAAILEANVRRNQLGVQVERRAVSESCGTARFFLPRSDMSGSLESSFNADIERVLEVPTTTLDEALRQERGGPMVIKIDAEGHEPAILRGARGLLDRASPDWILEVTEDYDESTVSLLKSRGYTFYAITDRGLEPFSSLRVARRGDYLFLNTLVTRRSGAEIAALSARLLPAFGAIDPASTCHFRPLKQGGERPRPPATTTGRAAPHEPPAVAAVS